MKERPVLFSAPMVRSILAGRKTKTRRVVNLPAWLHPDEINDAIAALNRHGGKAAKRGPCDGLRSFGCPYGVPGDRMWVREAFRIAATMDGQPHTLAVPQAVWYAADDAIPRLLGRGRPSIRMPRWASRLTLDVESVRVERLQDITEEDAIAEGAEFEVQEFNGTGQWGFKGVRGAYGDTAREAFAGLWDSLAQDGAKWADNPWVWVVGFRRVP